MSSARPGGDDHRAVWDAVAEGWDRHHEVLTAHTQPVTRRLLEVAAVQPGDVALELAAGLGGLSSALAQLVSLSGRVIGTDLSPEMVKLADQRAVDVDNLSFQVLDAQHLEFADASIDVIVCKMGLMLFADPVAAVRACRRVLRPDGRLAVATWGPAERNLWITTFGAAMLTHGHQPPGDATQSGGIFSLSDPDRLGDLLASAGFADVTVETIDAPQTFAAFDHYWQHVSETSGPLTVILQGLPSDEVDAIRATCGEYAAHLRAEDGTYTFPGHALVAAARQPQVAVPAGVQHRS